MKQQLTASGSSTNTLRFDLPVYGDTILRVSAWTDNFSDVYFRLLNNGQPIVPVTGFINIPSLVPVEFTMERQIEGSPFVLTLEAYHTGAGNEDIRLIVETGTVKEKDINLHILQRLDQIAGMLNHKFYNGTPTINPKG